jgi:DNA-binding LacI/PurR family transcriptional regulator
MHSLLAREPALDAVFAGSDLMALGALAVVREAGRRCPRRSPSSASTTASPPASPCRR